MELYPCKSGLGLMEPIALIDHNVCLIQSTQRIYRRVVYFEPRPPFQFLNIGAIAAQTTSARTRASDLDLYDGEFGQYRWFVLDDVQMRLFVPQTTGKTVGKNLQIPYDMNVMSRDPDLHLTEFFQWEDKSAYFEAANVSDYGLTQCRLVAMGYRFITEELSAVVVNKIKAGTENCVKIPVAGSAGRMQ